jgi:two-component system, NarL family, nitrate/nitrite response regulator NarL
MFGRQTTEVGTESGLKARIAGLSAWRKKALTNSPLPEKMIAPPPSVKMIAPVPTIEPESTIEERLVIAREELSARLGAKIPPVRRALLGPGDMANIVDGAVQAYFVRHAMNVDPLACRDLVTDIVETLIAPAATAEGAKRSSHKAAMEAAKVQSQPRVLEHMDIGTAAVLLRPAFAAQLTAWVKETRGSRMHSAAVQSARPSSRGKELLSLVPIVVCESPLFRAGLFHCLAGSRYWIKAEGSKLSDLSESVFSDQRCVALISLDGEATDILSQVQSLTERYNGLHIITLTERFCSEELLAAIGAGADGYLLRNEISAAALVQSLDVVLLGGVVIPKGLAQTKRVQPPLDAVPALQNPEDRSERGQLQPTIDLAQTGDVIRLSERERTILMQLMEGASNKHIARALNIAEATVKVHVKNLLRKIRVKNRTQAAMWGMGCARANYHLEQRPVGCPTGGDDHKISVTIPNGHDATPLNEFCATDDRGQVHAEIDFKGGFG